ncbi:MAG: chloride channel protein, partial [Asgard group archaeon]|nr:chloride channel protein [Asgard group archaeon]
MTSKKKKSLEEKDKEIDVIDKEESTSELKFYIDNRLKESRISIKKAWKNFIYDIKHPRKAIVELFKSKYFVINAIAIVVGIIGALSAWAFEWLVEGANIIFLQKLFPLIAESFNAGRFLAIIITPLLAVLLTAPLIWIFNPESKGSGIPNVMESIALYDGYMRKRTPFVKLFTSAICSGGGLSVGKEGPITQIGAGFSSGIAHIVGLHGRNMKIVVISGLSAAIAATFNSPIGGALFGIEILLVSLIADEIIPIILASLTSSTFSALIDILKLSPHSTGIPEPSFKVDVLRNLGWTSFIYDLHWFLILGIIAGLIGVFYSKFFHLVRELFDRLPISKLYIPIFGAILSGLVALLSPKESSGVPLIFGGSYSTITNILNNDVTTLSNQNPLNSLISF